MHAHLQLRLLDPLVGEVEDVVFEVKLIAQELVLGEGHEAHGVSEHESGEAALECLHGEDIVAVGAEDAAGLVDGEDVGMLSCELEVLELQLLAREGPLRDLSARSLEVELHVSELVHREDLEGLVAVLEEEVLHIALDEAYEVMLAPLDLEDRTVGSDHCQRVLADLLGLHG